MNKHYRKPSKTRYHVMVMVLLLIVTPLAIGVYITADNENCLNDSSNISLSTLLPSIYNSSTLSNLSISIDSLINKEYDKKIVFFDAKDLNTFSSEENYLFSQFKKHHINAEKTAIKSDYHEFVIKTDKLFVQGNGNTVLIYNNPSEIIIKGRDNTIYYPNTAMPNVTNDLLPFKRLKYDNVEYVGIGKPTLEKINATSNKNYYKIEKWGKCSTAGDKNVFRCYYHVINYRTVNNVRAIDMHSYIKSSPNLQRFFKSGEIYDFLRDD